MAARAGPAMGFKEWIIPQDRVFYDLLERHIGLAAEATQEFKFLLSHYSNLEIERQKVKEIENTADSIGHEVFERLNRTFITPIDREDIARLAHAIDDVVDAVYAATNRLVLFEIPEPTPEMLEFIGLIEAQVKELVAGIAALRKPNSLAKAIPPHVIEVHRLENLGDRLLNRVTAELFKSKDAVRILKYKEVYEFLEGATDTCEDVADVLQDILRKHG